MKTLFDPATGEVSYNANISGNFVVGLARQIDSDNVTTIWAATLPADKEGERRGLIKKN